jgi:di/tricarboxylate transporter
MTVLALYLFTREKIPLDGVCIDDCWRRAGSHRCFGAGGTPSWSRLEAQPGGGIAGHTVATLVIGAVLSAFMNNTPVVVLMLPMLIGAAIRSQTPTAGVLLPMGLATLIGGMGTTIGTSTNLLVVSVAADMGMERFGMFDFLPPVLIAGGLAVVYLWLIAPRLIPDRKPPMADTSHRVYHAQLTIPKSSRLVGQRMRAIFKKTGDEIQINRILRNNNIYISPLPDIEIFAGDKLLVTDTVDRLTDFEAMLGAKLGSVGEEGWTPGLRQQLAEVVVMGGSRLHGMKLGDVRLKKRYGLDLLAVHRAGGVIGFGTPELEQLQLRASDVLLVKATAPDISELKLGGELLVLDSSMYLPHTDKAPLALITMIGVILLAALGVVPIHVSALMGCFVLISTACITWREAAQALSTQVILIIVASLALGSALMRTGGADYLAQVFLFSTWGMSPPLVLAALMLLLAVLTNIVSNNAAAVIGTPIAISIAMELGLPLEPFVLAVLFGANLSFVTPMAYKTNLLVMNAGGYKFVDFVRVGTPLTLIMWVALSLVLSYGYGLMG